MNISYFYGLSCRRFRYFRHKMNKNISKRVPHLWSAFTKLGLLFIIYEPVTFVLLIPPELQIKNIIVLISELKGKARQL